MMMMIGIMAMSHLLILYMIGNDGGNNSNNNKLKYEV
jgi:hypothetical protein